MNTFKRERPCSVYTLFLKLTVRLIIIIQKLAQLNQQPRTTHIPHLQMVDIVVLQCFQTEYTAAGAARDEVLAQSIALPNPTHKLHAATAKKRLNA